MDAQQSTFDNCFVIARVKHVARSIKKLCLCKAARTWNVKGIRISAFSFQSRKARNGSKQESAKAFSSFECNAAERAGAAAVAALAVLAAAVAAAAMPF